MGFFSEIGDFLKNPLDYAGDKLGELNYRGQKETWDYQTSHAYQNTMEDLRKAGLNPMLAYVNGANTSGASSAMSLGDVTSAGKDIASLLPNGKMKATRKDRDLETQQGKLMEAQTAAALADKASKDATTAKTIQETKPLIRRNKVFDGSPDLANVEVGRDLLGDIGAGLAVVQNVIRSGSNSAEEYKAKMDKFKKSVSSRVIPMESR